MLAVATTAAARLINMDRPLHAAATSSRSFPTRITFPSGITQSPETCKTLVADLVAIDWSGCESDSLTALGSGNRKTRNANAGQVARIAGMPSRESPSPKITMNSVAVSDQLCPRE